jgi:rhomboid protease GluP
MGSTLFFIFVVSVIALIIFSPVIVSQIIARMRRKSEAKLPPKEINYGRFANNFIFKDAKATRYLLITLILIYIGEMIFVVVPSENIFTFSVPSLFAFGGLNQEIVIERNEWFRFFTAPLLHANFMHIFCNSIVLFFGGMILEEIVGPIWLLTIFFGGAFGGSLMSFEIGDAHMISVGASGGIMAILASAMILARKLPDKLTRSNAQSGVLRILLPALIPQIGSNVDYLAHFVGAIVGTIIGLILYVAWSKDLQKVYPVLNPLAKLIAISGIIISTVSFGIIVVDYKKNSDEIKNELLKKASS